MDLQHFFEVMDQLSSRGPRSLRSVEEGRVDGVRDTILLSFSDGSELYVSANADDDTAGVSLERPVTGEARHFAPMAESPLWQSLIGKKLGWGWLTKNQQGYTDGVMLSFHGVIPSVLFYVIASGIDVFSLLRADVT